jgi:AbrB family looped-hinge helix DNA binding protein
MKIETSVVTTKGQLVIPARLRRRFGIKKGTMVTFMEDGGRGSLQGGPSALAALLEERQREREL